jgi:hypothetical protein
MNKMLLVVLLLGSAAVPRAGWAGGAWVPEPGQGDLQLGFSRKAAHTSWDSGGNSFTNTTVVDGVVEEHHHDFRYTYLSGEIGLLRRLSLTFLTTYLHGLEGPLDDLEKNTGLSDAWFGLKYALHQGDLPMALAFTYRTPYFYDLEGPYSRYLYDSQGNIRDVSPEWRGLLKEDYTLSYLVSRSLFTNGWGSFQIGYTWRSGAPADELPVLADVGIPVPFWNAHAKVSAVYVRSMGNDSPRRPDDRFGSRSGFNFNDASMARAGVSLIVPYGSWSLEAGYNQWLWGESARQYEEPYLSINRRF